MEKYITQAVKTFFDTTLGLECDLISSCKLKKIHVSEISLNSADTKEIYQICMDQELLNEISSILLFEDNPDEEMIIDLVGECANLIIGNAKIIIEADKSLSDLSLSTPVYKGYYDREFLDDGDSYYCYEVNNKPFMITKSVVALESA